MTRKSSLFSPRNPSILANLAPDGPWNGNWRWASTAPHASPNRHTPLDPLPVVMQRIGVEVSEELVGTSLRNRSQREQHNKHTEQNYDDGNQYSLIHGILPSSYFT